MGSISIIVLLTSVVQVHAKVRGMFSDELIDKLVDKMFHPAIEHLDHGNLDETTLGKPNHLAVPASPPALKGIRYTRPVIGYSPAFQGTLARRFQHVRSTITDDAPRPMATTKITDDDGYEWDVWRPSLPLLDPHPPLLTYWVARDLQAAQKKNQTTLNATLDFGISTTTLNVTDNGAVGPDGALLATWEDIKRVAKDERGSWILRPGEPAEKFLVYSPISNAACSLMPSKPGKPPTALLNGFCMHRWGKEVDPGMHAELIMECVAPIRKGARVLDTCTGLGYTAIAASQRGNVTTIEVDPAMTQVCQMNPHSRELFQGGIKQIYGNAAEIVKILPNNSFDVIIHDPPTSLIAGELFATDFYKDLHRVLAPNGRMYHYIGEPTSQTSMKKGVMKRLRQAGFGGVVLDRVAHGIVVGHDNVRINTHRIERIYKDRPPGGSGQVTTDDFYKSEFNLLCDPNLPTFDPNDQIFLALAKEISALPVRGDPRTFEFEDGFDPIVGLDLDGELDWDLPGPLELPEFEVSRSPNLPIRKPTYPSKALPSETKEPAGETKLLPPGGVPSYAEFLDESNEELPEQYPADLPQATVDRLKYYSRKMSKKEMLKEKLHGNKYSPF